MDDWEAQLSRRFPTLIFKTKQEGKQTARRLIHGSEGGMESYKGNAVSLRAESRTIKTASLS